jgi:hypothetical protein
MTDSGDPAGKTSRSYRNPPSEHRFRKGVSGNPKGRPRKERVLVGTIFDDKPGFGFEDRIKALAIEEAYRLITIREGDRVEKIPVIQAILRKVAVAAANGNTRAQQNYLTLLTGAEADRRMAAAKILKFNVQYKEKWDGIFAKRALNGETGPDPLPHPDDIIIDPKTGEVTIDGPVTLEQKRAQDQLCAEGPELVQELREIDERIKSNPNDLGLRKQKKELTKNLNFVFEIIRKRNLRRALRTAPTESKWESSAARRRKRAHVVE